MANPLVVFAGEEDELEGFLDGLSSHGQLVMSDVDNRLAYGLGDLREILTAHLAGGLHLIVHPESFNFLEDLGLSLREASCSTTTVRQVSGGGFEHAPSEMPQVESSMLCAQNSSLPDSVDGVYGAGDHASAWTTPYGGGRVTYLGVPYRDMPSQWQRLLLSSLNASCANEDEEYNASNTTGTLVACGSMVSGSSLDFGNTARDVKFLFCPNVSGRVRISSCGSDVDTRLHVRGPDVDVFCDEDCGSCGRQAEVTVDVENGLCYEIHLRGQVFFRGEYMLSLTCSPPIGALACGSTVSGSTVGLPDTMGHPAGDASYSFCPNATGPGRVTVSTCQSSFSTWLHVQGPALTYSCGDCGSCGDSSAAQATQATQATQAEASFDFNPGDCYSISIEGRDRQEGEYIMSLSCTESTETTFPIDAPLTCPVYIYADTQLRSKSGCCSSVVFVVFKVCKGLEFRD